MSNIQTGTYLGRFAVGHFIHVRLTLRHEMRRYITQMVPTSTLEIHSILVRIGLIVVKLLTCVIHLVIQIWLD